MKLQLNVGGCDFSKFNHEMDAQRGECRAAQDVLELLDVLGNIPRPLRMSKSCGWTRRGAKAQRSIYVTCSADYFPLEGRFQSLLG